MNRRVSIILVIALIGIFLVLVILSSPNFLKVSYYRLLYLFTSPQGSPQKLGSLHQPAIANKDNRVDSAPCLACHGSMIEPGKENHKKAKNPIHQAMLTAPLLNFQCVDCHPKVDLRKRTPTHVTTKVDRKFCAEFPCHNPSITQAHGEDLPSAKKWLLKHPRLASSLGINQCRQCHIPQTELDVCQKCHLRGGFRASSHRATYTVPVNRIYPEIPRTDTITTKWRGFHFVFVREAMAKMGVSQVSASNLPLDKVRELPCKFCHKLEDWCTRCHIKHAPNWLQPDGHPARVKESGSDYCFRCHDELGSKCKSCHGHD